MEAAVSLLSFLRMFRHGRVANFLYSGSHVAREILGEANLRPRQVRPADSDSDGR
jgi:prepilin-type processing-associated H-X9-DG protein